MKLAGRGITVFLTAHILSIAERMANAGGDDPAGADCARRGAGGSDGVAGGHLLRPGGRAAFRGDGVAGAAAIPEPARVKARSRQRLKISAPDDDKDLGLDPQRSAGPTPSARTKMR